MLNQTALETIDFNFMVKKTLRHFSFHIFFLVPVEKESHKISY